MPGRQSHGHAPTASKSKTTSRKNNTKRSQNAFAIASHEVGDQLKSRKSRLGQLEGPLSRSKKRSRTNDEDEDGFSDEEEEDNTSKKQKVKKGRFDQLDNDAGSDSEGNEWVMGEAGEDDSDIDSDDAFGESDEEKFDGYAFSGSTAKPKKKVKAVRPLDLNEEGEESGSDEDDSDASLGEDAIDLATMLDQTAESSEDEATSKPKVADVSDDEEDEQDGQSDSDDSDDSGSELDSSASSIDQDDDDDDDVQDPEKLAALQTLVANLSSEPTSKPSRQRSDGASEYNQSSEYGITSRTKLTLADLGLDTIKDSKIKDSLKFVDADSKKKSAVLAVPLARRQQDRLDREAAYEQSKKTLDRWTDTVVRNRRAEHLSFPLVDHDKASALANTRLDTTSTKPHNELEAAIQAIMVESGLAVKHNDDEPAYDELEAKKLTLEEVKARRDQLRMARELMFREEAKSKRIKKIKSKSYRRVHRKERERQEEKETAALREAGIEPDEDERETLDRQRAEARMGDKHGRSKWAKATKSTGRAGWDDDARAGITEMARKEEELKARIAGLKSTRYEDEMDDSESEEESDNDIAGMRLKDKLDTLSKPTSAHGPGSRLANMDFMLKADAKKKKENEAMISDIRRDLDDNSEDETEDVEEDEAEDIGRRMFGPSAAAAAATKPAKEPLAQLEERLDSDEDEDEEEVEIKLTSTTPASDSANPWTKVTSKKTNKPLSNPQLTPPDSDSPWTAARKKGTGAAADSEHKRRKQLKSSDLLELDLTNAPQTLTAPSKKPTKPTKPKGEAKFMADTMSSSDTSDDEEQPKLPYTIRDQDLLKRAFQGDVVQEAFEAEKKATMEAEDEKIVDTAIPGWGSWVGEGVSKRERNRNKGRFLTKVEGIKQADRRDAGLRNVILNEKRVKKNAKYLAPQLPHTFETKTQYERSLRMPVGPEWTTKETFQKATKPRVLVKQGIIKPMQKPLV